MAWKDLREWETIFKKERWKNLKQRVEILRCQGIRETSLIAAIKLKLRI